MGNFIGYFTPGSKVSAEEFMDAVDRNVYGLCLPYMSLYALP